MKEMTELRKQTNRLFQEFLNYKETSESGRVFNPIKVVCNKPEILDNLNECLRRLEDKRLGEESLKGELRLFFKYLDLEDSPVYISSVRVLMTEELSKLLETLRGLIS